MCASLAAAGQLCRAQGESIHLPNTSGQSVGFVRIPGTTALAPQRFTIEAWIRPDGPGFGNTNDSFGAWIIGQLQEGAGGSNIGSYILRWAPSGLCNVDVNRSPGVGVRLFATTPIPRGTVGHVAVTFDGGTVRMFINGAAAGALAYPHPAVYASNEPVRIGAAEAIGGYLRRFHGLIDDVRIWDHARSPAEIADFMHCRLKGDEPGLLAYWSMDVRGPGGEIVDDSCHGHHGTVAGTLGHEPDAALMSACNGRAPDCNANNLADCADIQLGTSCDVNGNRVPDECEPPCYANYNGDCALDIFDFLLFQNDFALGVARACDCDTGGGPLVCDIFDFLCFQNAFATGCP